MIDAPTSDHVNIYKDNRNAKSNQLALILRSVTDYAVNILNNSFMKILDNKLGKYWDSFITKNPPWNLDEILDIIKKLWMSVFKESYSEAILKENEQLGRLYKKLCIYELLQKDSDAFTTEISLVYLGMIKSLLYVCNDGEMIIKERNQLLVRWKSEISNC